MTEERTALEFGQAVEGRQFVHFSLNSEEYAVDAISVQEIIKLGKIRKVPHLPDFFRGVINLRGTIIPVMDLKLRFGMHAGEYHDQTCIIITEFSRGVIGLIVDEVSDVVRLPDEALSETPAFGTTVRTDFIQGVGRVDDAMIIILDVERVLTDEEVSLLEKSSLAEISRKPGEGEGSDSAESDDPEE